MRYYVRVEADGRTPRQRLRADEAGRVSIWRGGDWMEVPALSVMELDGLDASLTERWDIACRFPSTHIG